jgi:hypothetical protein
LIHCFLLSEFPSLQELDLCPVTLAERHEALMSQNSGPLIEFVIIAFFNEVFFFVLNVLLFQYHAQIGVS